jgi:hypothetical protein
MLIWGLGVDELSDGAWGCEAKFILPSVAAVLKK